MKFEMKESQDMLCGKLLHYRVKLDLFRISFDHT